MSKIDIVAFHGTDANAARKIVNEKFLVRGSDEYWLGNGAYFFLDRSLAQWWTTRPSKSFGNSVRTPAIVNADISLDDDAVLDLRKLSDFKEFANIYKNDFLPEFFSGRIFAPELITTKKLRCTYCDYLRNMYDLKAIIGTFSSVSQPYLGDDFGTYFKKFDIIYTETQLCVFDQSCILNKTFDYVESGLEV